MTVTTPEALLTIDVLGLELRKRPLFDQLGPEHDALLKVVVAQQGQTDIFMTLSYRADNSGGPVPK